MSFLEEQIVKNHLMQRNLLFSVALVVTVVFFSGQLFAQNEQFNEIKKSVVQLNGGSGFYSGGFPLYAFADFNVHPDWTVGPQVNFVFYDHFHFVLSGRVDYHFNRLLDIPSDAWDFYGGATMGIDFSNHTEFSSGLHVGGRWYWNKTWGLNAEIGGGTYFSATLGVSMRL